MCCKTWINSTLCTSPTTVVYGPRYVITCEECCVTHTPRQYGTRYGSGQNYDEQGQDQPDDVSHRKTLIDPTHHVHDSVGQLPERMWWFWWRGKYSRNLYHHPAHTDVHD